MRPSAVLVVVLAIVREHAGLSALSACGFNELVKYETMRRVMEEALAADK
jgi:hypothetical protein